MLRTYGLTRHFGNVVAVEDLNLEVYKGEVFGLLGPNGAGKTTAVRMLCCLLGPTRGTAEVLGRPLGRPADAEYIRSKVGLLPEAHGLYERLSAYKNLDYHAQLYGVPEASRRERIEGLLRMLDVWHRRDDAVATFSRGMRQKIAIARAVVHDPELLFLDEPTASLDPEASVTVREMILELKEEGRTIFLNTHNLEEAQKVCDRIAILKTRLVAVGNPEQLARQRFGRWTRITIRQPSDVVAQAVRASDLAKEVRVDGASILARLEDPEADNPRLARIVLDAGGEIVFLGEEERGLEDLYLSLVGGAA